MAWCASFLVGPWRALDHRRHRSDRCRVCVTGARALLAAAVALTTAGASLWAADVRAVPRREPGPVGLALAPTPTLPSLLDLERRQLVPDAVKERARIAADRAARLAALHSSRTFAPMAVDAAARDHDLADAARDVALIAWHQGLLACQALLQPLPRPSVPPRRRKAPPPPPPPPPTCPPPLALGEVIAAYQRVLAQDPQYRRADDVRFQLAQLSLRQAREDNDPDRALQARAALSALKRSLAPGVLRDHAELWLAEDDAQSGRDDIALEHWERLAAARSAEFATIYARLRAAWSHWSYGRTALAVESLTPASATKSTNPWQQLQRAHHAWMVARLRAKAAAAAAEVTAAAKASAEPPPPLPSVDGATSPVQATAQRPVPAPDSGKPAAATPAAPKRAAGPAKPSEAPPATWPRQTAPKGR